MKFSSLNPLPAMTFSALTIPRLGLAAFRSRLLVRGIFVALMLAVLVLAVMLLNEEKQRSYQHYQNNIGRTQAEIMAKLRHPAGALALLNARFTGGNATEADPTGVSPLLLPFGALDFDDLYKAQQAIEMSGCSMHFADQSSLCVGVGSNPYAGGFIYLVGEFQTESLVGRERGQLDLSTVHHARVRVSLRGDTTHWLAPLEILPAAEATRMSLRGMVAGRLPGFEMKSEQAMALEKETRPVRDFRAWMWQRAQCDGAETIENSTSCKHRTWFSMRVPVAAFQADLFEKPGAVVWPPADLNRIKVAVQIVNPIDSPPRPIFQQPMADTAETFDAPSVPVTTPVSVPTVAFDSQQPQTLAPFSLQDLGMGLQPGETLQIYKVSNIKNITMPRSVAQEQGQLQSIHTPENQGVPMVTVRGQVSEGNISPFITRLIRWLPVQAVPNQIERRDRLHTPVGSYDVIFHSDVHGIDKSLSAVATRLSWFVAAMLGALLLASMVIEIGFMRRIARLTKRAATVSHNMPDSHAEASDGVLKQLAFNDLRGSDEVGILAGSLADLLQRVKEDVQRAQIRAQQEREMWHAVGHEIMSPLQSLMVLHQGEADPSHRYIQRMQQAVKVLYGQASPSEAIAAANLELEGVDLVSFLAMVAENAHFAGIEQVIFVAPPTLDKLMVRADEFSLEDVLTHVLRNAARYRLPNTPITVRIDQHEAQAHITIHNQGPQIDEAMLEKIFEYGVSDTAVDTHESQRGQGLFVARTYLAKMGGTIRAENVEDGVAFRIHLPVVG